MRIEIGLRAGPRKESVNFRCGCGFRHLFQMGQHGEQNGGVELGFSAEAKVDDGWRTARPAHADADAAGIIAEANFPMPAIAKKAEHAVAGVGLHSLEGHTSGFFVERSGCPHQLFRRLPS